MDSPFQDGCARLRTTSFNPFFDSEEIWYLLLTIATNRKMKLSSLLSFRFRYQGLLENEKKRFKVFHIVKPLITNTSEEFIKCRLDNFSMSFILYYVNFSICENK